MGLSIQFFLFQIEIILFVAINYGDTSPPAPIVCDKNLIKGQAAVYLYDNNNNKLTCKDDKFIKVGTAATLYDELKCDAANGWTTDGTTKLTTPITANAELNIECVPICVDNTPAPAQVKREPETADPKKFKISCKSDKAALRVISDGTNEYSNEITCNKYGWADGNVVFAEADKKLTLSCKKYCEVTGTPDHKFESILGQNNDQINIKCNEPEFFLVKGNDVLAPDATCSKDGGWKFNSVRISRPSHDHKTILNVECKEVCAYDKSDADLKLDSNSNTLTCQTSTKELHVDGVKYQQLICDSYNGWRKNVTDTSIVKPSHEKLSATCVEPPNPIPTTTAPTTAPTTPKSDESSKDVNWMRIFLPLIIIVVIVALVIVIVLIDTKRKRAKEAKEASEAEPKNGKGCAPKTETAPLMKSQRPAAAAAQPSL